MVIDVQCTYYRLNVVVQALQGLQASKQRRQSGPIEEDRTTSSLGGSHLGGSRAYRVHFLDRLSSGFFLTTSRQVCTFVV